MSNDVNTLEKEPEQANTVQKIEKVYLRPLADVYRNEEKVRVLVDLPGATEEKVDVSVHNGQLTIKAEVERSETDVRIYERAFRVDNRLNTAEMDAVLQHGVLEVSIPFREEARPRKIEIKTRS